MLYQSKNNKLNSSIVISLFMLLFKYSIMLQTKSLENIVSPTHLVVYHIFT